MPFQYKTVLVTGATSGIGKALVERLLSAVDGVFIIAVGRRQDRLDELQTKYGPSKIATENFDVTDLAALPAWAAKITAAYPALDCVVLNAGFQQSFDFTQPGSVVGELPLLDTELTVNYLSPVHATALFMPHFAGLAAQSKPSALVYLTSGLALVPIARCPNYCASKAALHSFTWTMRAQLQENEATRDYVRIIEIVPPAVQTELHIRQGQAPTGLPLAQFIDETWEGLSADEPVDEIMPKNLKAMMGQVDDVKREKFKNMAAFLKAQQAAAAASQ
ncbi:MAG: hypothetical protein STHCBS139747_005291 [Sporothrix thermara]